jgi:alanyl-tRNA synthetase
MPMAAMIKCDVTQKLVPTGAIAVDGLNVKSLVFEDCSSENCAACGGTHVWSTGDVVWVPQA